ncbi:hypothetical protein PG996_013768 [Apiospora saccharicola]|uniref:Fungal STAND N-terminal Goodbye domain-containing protein n=1 Tax=Apiospora saccharicola TaxID=335842 RepID=A0ABR1TGF0_9PEZI
MADSKSHESPIRVIWAAAAEEFTRLTKRSLDNGAIDSFDALQREIESRSMPPSGDASADAGKWDKERFKSAGFRVLKCLKILLGAATQLSDTLPVPSGPVVNVCANALMMLLDIPQKISDLEDAISDVFATVSSLLSQMRIFERMDKIDDELARRIHLVMISFVTVSAHVVNYEQGGRWKKLKQKTMKAILNDDSGLQAEMKTLNDRVQQQRDVGGTLVLEAVIASRQDLCKVLEQVSETGERTRDIQVKVTRLDNDATETREEKDKTKRLKNIRDTLSVPSYVRLDTNTTDTCTALFKKCFEGTGDWISNHPFYQEWSSKKGHDPLLLLSGDTESGKTSIAAKVTKTLEDQQAMRVYAAHYFFSPSSLNKKSDVDKYPVQSAMKYMAFQIARVDTTVAKALDKACDGPERAQFRSQTDLKQLWAQLNIGLSGQGPTYHLIFDGLEHLPEKNARELVDFALSLKSAPDAAGSRVRVLLSGSNKVFDDHPGSEAALRINVREHTIPDMEIVVNHELEGWEMLQHVKIGSKLERARDLIREQLPQNVKGSYFLLQCSLDNIKGRLELGAGMEELEKMLEKSMDSHEAAIQRLQRSLGPDEIEALNELLK